MLNYADVCDGRIELEVLMRDLSEMWKSLESNSNIMFSVTLMFWEYIDTSLMTRVQPRY